MKRNKALLWIVVVIFCVGLLSTLTSCANTYDMSGVSFKDKTVEYNRQTQTLTVEGTLPDGVSVAYSYYSDAEHTKRVTAAVSVGTYYVVASFTGEEGYKAIEDMTAVLTIIEGNYDLSGIKFDNKVVQYSGQPQTISITGTLPVGVSVAYEYYSDAEHKNKVEAANVVNVGTYYAVASFTGAEGYKKPADMTATLTVSKLDLSGISFTDKEVPYSGEAQEITITGKLPEVLSVSYEYYSDDKFTVKVDADKVVSAGTYYVKAIISGKDETEQETLTAKLVITPVAPGTIVLADKTVDYNGQTQALAIAGGGLPSGVTVTYHYYLDAKRTQEASSVIDAGVYYVTATFESTGSYVKPDDLEAKLTINKISYDNVDFTVSGTYLENDTTEKTVTARQEEGQTFYVEYQNADYTIKLNTFNADGDTTTRPTIKFFRTQQEDGTLTDPELTNNTIKAVGDVIYMQATFQDKNHNEAVVVKKIIVQKTTFELSTFEDLAIMRAHIFGGTVNGQTVEPLERGFRKSVRYVLKNDIDCENQVWTPVQTAVYRGLSASVVSDHAFCSEFDGKGFTISNYRITADSFDMDEIKDNQIDQHTRLHIGFFGYANECEIHDVTFDKVNITLDEAFVNTDFAPLTAGGDVIYYVGFVVGRLDSSKSQEFDKSDLYNITVKNSKIDLKGVRIYAGGIAGIEYVGPGAGAGSQQNVFGKRDNLAVTDCTIYASRAKGSSEVAIGGIDGRIAIDPSSPDSTITFTGCTIKNIKLGYDIEAYLAADEDGKAALLPTSNILVGICFGRVDVVRSAIVNCTLENYLIGAGSFTGITGKFVNGLFPVVNEDCTLKQDSTWNGGVNGIYNISGQQVDETEQDSEYFRWA